MPANINQGGEDLYADAATPDPSVKTGKTDMSESEGNTSLLDKKFCPGLVPGDEIVVKVVRAHDDQYEVSYAPEPKETEEAEPVEEPPAPESSGPDEMTSMMEN